MFQNGNQQLKLRENTMGVQMNCFSLKNLQVASRLDISSTTNISACEVQVQQVRNRCTSQHG